MLREDIVTCRRYARRSNDVMETIQSKVTASEVGLVRMLLPAEMEQKMSKKRASAFFAENRRAQGRRRHEAWSVFDGVVRLQ